MVVVKLNRSAFRLALARENLSQRELAQKIGFSRCHISHIVNGRREPSPSMRRRILEHLKDYTFDDLFTIEGSKNGD